LDYSGNWDTWKKCKNYIEYICSVTLCGLVNCNTLILFYKQRFISNTKYEKTSWIVAYKTE
jgi:hypothetical protein